jgi:hypothetical protein
MLPTHQFDGNRSMRARGNETSSLRQRVNIVFLLAFLLNLVWELLHVRFYAGLPMSAGGKMFICTLATFADACYVALIYLIREYIDWGEVWPARANIKRTAFIGVTGLITATAVELVAQQFGLWRYSEVMPTVPVLHVGLSPMLQLAVTSLAAIGIAGRMQFSRKPVFAR